MVGQATNRKDLLKSSGNTADIISAILYADSQSASYTKELATQLQKPTVLDTCRAIYDFVKQNIEYKEDPDGFQFVQSPGHLYWGDKSKGNGQGDCKSMSVFCGSVLQNLGIKYAFRFVSQDRSKDLHHVFIVVPDEIGKPICLDCVDDCFNAHYHFSKVKDVLPTRMQAVAKVGAKIGEFALYEINQTSATGVVRNFSIDYPTWADYLFDYTAKMDPVFKIEEAMLLNKIDADWKSTAQWAWLEPISMLLLSAKGKDKMGGYYKEMMDYAGLHQLMYCYWDDSEAAFPANLKGKRDQALMFKEGLLNSKLNTRITAGFPDHKKPKFFNEYNLKLFCDWHCFKTYGYPLAMVLRKAYNMVNFGSDAIPILKQPYYNLKSGQWVANGASAADMQLLELCLPYSGGNFVPFGNPYWCKALFVMPNGADDATVKKYEAENPPPFTDMEPLTGQQLINQQKFFGEWWYKNILTTRFAIKGTGFAAVADGNQNTPKGFANPANTEPGKGWAGAVASVSGKRPKINGLPVAVIGAIITAVATIISSLLALISKMLDKQKSDQQIQADLTNYPVDFKAGYLTPDGCYMEPTNTLGVLSYTKRCPDGTVTPNANPNAPENQPANAATGLLSNLRSAWPLLLAAAGIGMLLIFSSSKKSKA